MNNVKEFYIIFHLSLVFYCQWHNECGICHSRDRNSVFVHIYAKYKHILSQQRVRNMKQQVPMLSCNIQTTIKHKKYLRFYKCILLIIIQKKTFHVALVFLVCLVYIIRLILNAAWACIFLSSSVSKVVRSLLG